MQLPAAPLRNLTKDRRLVLLEGALAVVEDSAVSADSPPPRGFSPNHQIVIPYLGVFGFRTHRRTDIFDANRTLFVTGNQEFADSHPVCGVGHASVIITPSEELLDEVCGVSGARGHQAFHDASRPATPRLRFIAHRLLASHRNRLAAAELTLAALREALPPSERWRPKPSQTVDRAKQVLHARGAINITLDDIAREVDVSAAYLTQEFTRSEGIPLYRYQNRLRLSRALAMLPECESIGELARSLGFASHSHFSAVFKATFGLTPSAVLALGDKRGLPSRSGAESWLQPRR